MNAEQFGKSSSGVGTGPLRNICLNVVAYVSVVSWTFLQQLWSRSRALFTNTIFVFAMMSVEHLNTSPAIFLKICCSLVTTDYIFFDVFESSFVLANPPVRMFWQLLMPPGWYPENELVFGCVGDVLWWYYLCWYL